MSEIVETFIDALRAGSGYLKDNPGLAVVVFIFVFIALLKKKIGPNRIEELPLDEQRTIQEREENYQFVGMIIGIVLAIGITLWMLFSIFFSDYS